jgi:hypothetical protein
VLTTSVFSGVAYSRQFTFKLLKQLFFDTFLQGYIYHRAAITTAAELHQCDAVVSDLY